VHRKYIPIYIQQDAALHSLFISGNCSTCFGWYLHSSSGAQTTLSTTSGICHTVTVLNTVGNCNTMVSIIILYYNLMGLPSYMRSVVDRNVVMRHIPVSGFLNPLSPELNPICYLLALLAHHFLHVSRIRVKLLTIRLLMSYIYGAPILDVSRSYTTTHHSR